MKLYEVGRDHYEAFEAFEAFLAASEAYEDATLLYNAARSAQKLGEIDRALELVRRARMLRARPLREEHIEPAEALEEELISQRQARALSRSTSPSELTSRDQLGEVYLRDFVT